MSKFRKSARAYKPRDADKAAPFQHWYRDNQVYFITARCRDRYPALASEQAKAIFWEQFNKYTAKHQFTPWVTSLLDNHWHTVGYLQLGADLAPMMNGIQGATSKLVNDLLQSEFYAGRLAPPPPPPSKYKRPVQPGRFVPFWYDTANKNYFDGCLRDELQATRTYRYVLTQCRRHHVGDDPATYPHTHIHQPLESALAQATKLRAFMYDVPYPRYASA